LFYYKEICYDARSHERKKHIFLRNYSGKRLGRKAIQEALHTIVKTTLTFKNLPTHVGKRIKIKSSIYIQKTERDSWVGSEMA
jgi:hypothetical protein